MSVTEWQLFLGQRRIAKNRLCTYVCIYASTYLSICYSPIYLFIQPIHSPFLSPIHSSGTNIPNALILCILGSEMQWQGSI